MKKRSKFIERIMINRKVYKKTFSKLSDAIKWKERMEEERRLIRSGESSSFTGLFMKDVCYEYLKTRVGTKDGTKETYKSVIKNYIIPNFGHIKMRDLKKSDGIKLIGMMEEKDKSPSTINKVLVILKCITKFAIENEYLDISPFITIKPLKVDARKYQYWTTDEAKEFLIKAKYHPLFNLFKFALNTGLRRGEICGLLWENVKINEGNVELHFNQQLLPGRVRDLVKGHSSRFVPLTSGAIAILDEIGRKGDKDYIFTLPNGKSVEPNYLSVEFKSAQKRLSIKKVIKFHATRHSFASLLTARGINIQKVQHLLGHKDSKVTERYSHLSQSELRSTVQIVDFSE